VDGWWQFLTIPENRETLGWIGGGLCVLASGLWAMVKYLRASPPPTAPEPSSRPRATGGDGIVAGGNVSVGGDVHIGHVALPRLAVALAALGMILLAAAAIFGRGDTTEESVVTDGGDIRGSNIVIGNPAPPER
jgi:hypothetical protein